MIMADVFAVFGTLLALGIALPGLLLTWRLLMPKVVDRARQRLRRTPWRCFFVGLVALGVCLIPIIILFNLPWEGFPAMGLLGLFILLAITSLGATGLAELMGQRLQQLGLTASPVGATVRGAVTMELAAVFPFVGWFIFVPLTTVVALGASIFALFGRAPRSTEEPVVSPAREERPLPAQ